MTLEKAFASSSGFHSNIFFDTAAKPPLFCSADDLRKDKPSLSAHGDAVPRVQFPRCPRTDSAVDKYPFRFKIRRGVRSGKMKYSRHGTVSAKGRYKQNFTIFFLRLEHRLFCSLAGYVRMSDPFQIFLDKGRYPFQTVEIRAAFRRADIPQRGTLDAEIDERAEIIPMRQRLGKLHVRRRNFQSDDGERLLVVAASKPCHLPFRAVKASPKRNARVSELFFRGVEILYLRER